MKRNPVRLLLAFLCLFLLGCATIVLLRKERDPNELTLYGNVDVRLVDIGFRVAGRLDKLFFEEGDVVQEGELLAVLDKSPYDSQVTQAIANVLSAEASFKNSQILLDRRQKLIGVGGVSQEELDNAQANFDEQRANLEQMKAQLAVQKDNYAYTEVYAPTSGIILTRVREPGTAVNATDPVLTISVASPVWVRAYVEEPDLGKIAFGMKATIFTDTKDAPLYTGTIGFISPMAEFTPKTVQSTELRTDLVYRIRVYVDNPDWRLKQGMPVTIKLRRHD